MKQAHFGAAQPRLDPFDRCHGCLPYSTSIADCILSSSCIIVAVVVDDDDDRAMHGCYIVVRGVLLLLCMVDYGTGMNIVWCLSLSRTVVQSLFVVD